MTSPMPVIKYRKKLIEVALPLEAINRESAREKSIRHGHPSTLHLWWARRPLATARAVLFAQLVDDPSAWPERFPTEEAQANERKRLFSIIEAMVPWEASNNEVVISQARREIAQSWARSHPSKKAERVLADDATTKEIDDYLATELPPVHDPFAGGGTIPLEAQRLGLRAIASDLNPVAVLINKALIEIPPRFAGLPPVNPRSRKSPSASHGKGRRRPAQPSLESICRSWTRAQGVADDVRYYGEWMRDEAHKRIGRLYPELKVTAGMAKGRPDLRDLVGEKLKVIAWLWARTVASPEPTLAGVHVPLVSSYWLAMKPGKEAWVEPVLKEREYRFQVRIGAPKHHEGIDGGTKLPGASFKCVLSGTPISPEYIRAEGRAGRLGARLMAVVAEGKRGRIYLDPRAEDEALAASAQPPWMPDEALPEEALGFRVQNYGITKWKDLFTARQATFLATMADLLDEVSAEVDKDEGRKSERGQAIAMLLACVLSRSADFGASLCMWSPAPKNEVAMHVFGRQTLSMTWDYAEINPFSDSSGNWLGAVEWVAKVIDLLPASLPGHAFQANAMDSGLLHSGRTPALLSCDPPYYDNVPYADLSDFFYIWLRRALRNIAPEITKTILVPKTDELVAEPARHGGRDGAERFFLEGMRRAFKAFVSDSLSEAPAAIYYAFKQAEGKAEGRSSTGWEVFLEAVIDSGFQVIGTWPMRTERPGRLRDVGSNALASSIILACARRPQNAATTTRTEFRRALHDELPAALGALLHGNVAPVDLPQAAIGPGMSIFSRYGKVLEADGSEMTVRTALQVINEVLDEHLMEQEGELDADSRFAVTWYEQRAFDAGPYGEAENLAKARAVAVHAVAEAGILKSGGGKVRLLKRGELRDDWDPAKDNRLTTWEATQHLIKRLEEKGEDAAAELLTKLGPRATAARDLAYRLYSTCERKGWTEEARAYNGLVVAWPDLERLANHGRETAASPTQQRLL